jgi:hypothetical protein
MNMFRKLTFLTILLVFLASLALPGTAYASSSAASSEPSQNQAVLPDQFVLGDTYTLRSGDTLAGDLVILGGSVTLEDGSVVDGSVILIGGSLSISGQVKKDLVAFGGSPIIESTGRIGGDAFTIGCSLSGDPERVAGDIVTEGSGVFHIKTFDERFPTVGVAKVPFLWNLLGLFFSVFFMTTLAIGIVLFLPKQTERTGQMLIHQPVASGGMGCLTMLVAPIILIALAITIILSPISLLGVGLLVALTIFGWVAMGLELGNRLAQALHQEWHPAAAAGIGTFCLTLTALGLSKVVILVGWMIPFLVSMVALGAVIMVFFGARQPSTAPAALAVQPVVASPVVEAVSRSTPAGEIPSSPDISDEEIPPAS